MKKILSVVLAVVVVLSALTVNVFATDVYTYDLSLIHISEPTRP